MTTQQMVDAGQVEVVATGTPETQLLACTRCGVLLWNPAKHYEDAHPLRMEMGI